MKLHILYFTLFLLMLGCVEKMTLPTSINTNTEFAAGDTTYLLVNPIWDETYGNGIISSVDEDWGGFTIWFFGPQKYCYLDANMIDSVEVLSESR